MAIKLSAVERPILASLSLKVLGPSLVHSSAKHSCQKSVWGWQAAASPSPHRAGDTGFEEEKELTSGMSD